jgi:hypothetical protein
MKRLVLPLPIVLVGVVACSSGNGSGDISTASGFADQFCQLFEPCCADAGLSTSGTECHALAALAASKGTYNASAGQACINALQSDSKSSAFCTDLGNNVPQCDNVFNASAGSAGPGQACKQDSDCAKAPGGSAICYSQSSFGDGGSSTTNTCVQTQKGMAGQGPCVDTVDGNVTSFDWATGTPPSMGYTCDVADGVSCNATTQKCAALGATGQACQQDQDCVTSDYCAYGGTGSPSCQPRVPAGATCGGATGAQCVTTATCDTSTSTCKALLPSGAACSGGQQCQSSLCSNGKCSASSNLGLALLCGG